MSSCIGKLGAGELLGWGELVGELMDEMMDELLLVGRMALKLVNYYSGVFYFGPFGLHLASRNRRLTD
ncbi:hypothetical protein PAENIP36_53510 [Paenibacillus sp. P36]